MKKQRIFIFYYTAVILSFFYFKYISLLKNERNQINFKRINFLKDSEKRPFENKFYVYHDNYHLAKKVSIKLNEFININDIPSSVLHVESYGSDYLSDDFTHSTLEDLTKLDKSFIVIVNYVESETSQSKDLAVPGGSAHRELDFNVSIKGGNTVVFTLLRNFSYSEQACERMFSLVKKLFINYGYKKLNSSVDVNFVLLSTERRVSWDFKNMLDSYLNNVLSCLSLFHDVDLHSKVVSNVDLYSKLSTTTSVETLESTNADSAGNTGKASENFNRNDYSNEGKDIYRDENKVIRENMTRSEGSEARKQVEHVTLELNTEFYNFFESLGNVDISMKDNHYYRNSLNFYLVVTEKRTFIKDPVTGESRQSFTIDNLGVFLFTTLEELGGGAGILTTSRENNAGSPIKDTHFLNENEMEQVISSWVTHIRHLYDLPASKSEFALSLSNPNEKLKVESEDGYILSSKGDVELKFRLQFQDPIGTAFYGFEVSRLSKSLYDSYVKASFENLSKLVDLANVSYNTQVPKSTFQHVNNSLDALEYLMGKSELDDTYLDQMDKNQRLLAMSKYSFLESLEALSDDQMFNRNVLSYEHQLAVFMCDVFPFAFPVLVYLLKLLSENLKSK